MNLFKTMATVMAAPLGLLQDPIIKVELHTNEARAVWYTNPMWLAIGGVVLLLFIVLAVVAVRGRGSNTTVVR